MCFIQSSKTVEIHIQNVKKRHLKIVHNVVDNCTQHCGYSSIILCTFLHNIVDKFYTMYFNGFNKPFKCFVELICIFHIWRSY